MPEELLFESEHRMHRDEVASCLRTVADRLAARRGDATGRRDSVTLEPPSRPTVEVTAEREARPTGGAG